MIWRSFNKFLQGLDSKPSKWEDRTTLFIGYMIDQGAQSATIKSYVSAIKCVLILDDYDWQEGRIALNTLTKACRLQNDTLCTRLPITKAFLGLIIFEVKRIFRDQLYLNIMYSVLFALAYYGLMRVGELTWSDHVLKVTDIHVVQNKQKLLAVLYSSKTHHKGNLPQKIKITSDGQQYQLKELCPFYLLHNFLKIRGNFKEVNEPFFVFLSGDVVKSSQARTILKNCISNLHLDTDLYNLQSLRIGRASDMLKYGFTIDQIKKAGRWRSNVVYKYLQ